MRTVSTWLLAGMLLALPFASAARKPMPRGPALADPAPDTVQSSANEKLPVPGAGVGITVASLHAVSAEESKTSGTSGASAKDAGGLRAQLRDPEDGAFDMSRWLLARKGGFLPVPIIITDPAVGNGGGVALVFFRRPEGQPPTRTDAQGRTRLNPPNIFGGAAVRTENGSEAYGAGAIMHFADDAWRWRGVAGKTSINLGFHTPGNAEPSREIEYNVDGVASVQQVFRRIGARDLYLGLGWTYTDMDIGFGTPEDSAEFLPHELASRSSGLGLSLQYDSRDNQFTPSSGVLAMVDGNVYSQSIGSDNDFETYRGYFYGYWPLGRHVVLGTRADLRAAQGDVPFYRLPYIDLRGIGAARYQDTRAATLESEVRWNLTHRWALIGFAGAGRTWGRNGDLDDAASRVSKGTGFRYLLARELGLYAGLDYAWGPEDGTFYVQVGGAWR